MYAVVTRSSHAYALWGSPARSDMDELLALFDDSYGRLPTHSILADLRRLGHVDLVAFARLQSYMSERREELSAMVSHAVMLLAPSVGGAMAAGFFAFVPAPFPVDVTTTIESAVARLGWPPDASGVYKRAIEQACGDLRSRLADYLSGRLGTATVAEAAKSLGHSERSLQRALGEAGTSFSSALADARLGRASHLLRETDRSITEIALEVGFASSEAFATAFRRHVGVTPSAYRNRPRGRA